MSDTQQYAISKYPDVAEIYRRLEELVSQPMRRVREERMQEYLAYFDKKCVRSKALTDRAKRFIPGGVQHNWPSITRSRLPSKKRKGLISGMWTGINILISCRPARRSYWAAITPRCAIRSLNFFIPAGL